ncbi:phage related protein [Agrobacterium tumefaciens]|uniref:Phage related protein n=1 Tax=Agrobacterium tumefaciens TaxID=358 RepID=A0A0D0L615_AGRTU|nr:phage related protein [Agrobacterium tumefaciens]
MTGAEIMAVGGFFVLLFGFFFGIWKYVDAKISSARSDATGTASAAHALAALARDELASHRLHVAETYITKAGMREMTVQIMDAVSGVKAAVDHMTVRVDRIVENQASKPRPTRSS